MELWLLWRFTNNWQSYQENKTQIRKIRKDIGEEKWRSIDTYINVHHPELRLDQIIYNSNNWIDFEKWFNKEIKVVNVNVLDVWKTDYDDYRADVEIGKGEINQGNVIASYDEDTIRNLNFYHQ